MKQLTALCLFIVTTGLYAQLPNGGFENWTTINGVSSPISWTTLNSTPISTGVTTCKKGTPGNPGNNYLKLISTTVSLGSAVLPGIATCAGSIDPITFKASGGFSFTQRPVNLTGAWQHMVMGNNNTQGFIRLFLTHWDTLQQIRDTVAYVSHTLSGMVMSWANFSIPLTYNNSLIPDTCMIILSASNISTANDGDYLYIDNLGFDGYSTGISVNEEELNTHLFPNPAGDEVNFNIDGRINNGDCISIYNLQGMLVKTIVLQSDKQKISITDLTNGYYTVLISSQQRVVSKKLIVNK